MTMRKKDYEAIARVLSDRMKASARPHPGDADALIVHNNTLDIAAQQIADYCATQDPTFKRDRFLADCGVSHD